MAVDLRNGFKGWSAHIVVVVVACLAIGAIAAALMNGRSTSQPVAGSIEGSAFVVLTNGDSQILRGLQATLLPATIRLDQTNVELFGGTLARLESEGEFSAPYLSERRNIQHRGDVAMLKERLPPLLSLSSGESRPVDLVALHGLLASAQRLLLFASDLVKAEWRAFVAPHVRANTHTDVNGSFRFENVEPGHYVLFAERSVGREQTEWAVPLAVADGQMTKVDLFNHNATDTTHGRGGVP